eukprot:c1485_g1_i1.p1 GENE.c1485_g1_i1~~c1485_g1_i1.p1  ORF type:complete len:399 (+),score=83.68 c1485_g1_i1:100-1296(+)
MALPPGGATFASRRRAAEAPPMDPEQRAAVLVAAQQELIVFLNEKMGKKASPDQLTELLVSEDVMNGMSALSAGDRTRFADLVARCIDCQYASSPSAGSTRAEQVEALLRTGGKISSLQLPALGSMGKGAALGYDFAVCNFEEISINEVIGAGAFGQVMRGTFKGADVAVKRMVGMGDTGNQDEFQDFLREATLLAKLDHPNCVKFFCATVTFPNVCLVTEYVGGGDLDHLIHETDAALDVVQILRDVASAMAYLHSRRIVHRDLKPGNILITNDGHAKVADYGLAKERTGTYLQTKCGSPVYVGPEVIRGDPYSEAADVYSFGVLAWELSQRAEPFTEKEYETLMDLIKDIVLHGARPGPMADSTPPYVQEMVRACIEREPTKRPPFSQLAAGLQFL